MLPALAAIERRSLGVVRASAAGEAAHAAAKPINFKAYERPQLPASRAPPPPLAGAGAYGPSPGGLFFPAASSASDQLT